ncbi:AraC family transcriptional regulator [Leptospira sp. GIMC2001]|uniref:AraC family transcriptional regulator n=1 Tax=Leptospira sp. GIMC2001 TaxID=1513297 RepID=UPI00234A92A6|nr:helix-turn-helix domain-containing protein [Leptospira sp. GIMC2001]WCL48229.1 helix-turn-helix domain-containing protein [Leptospira sp. GIMC2001]
MHYPFDFAVLFFAGIFSFVWVVGATLNQNRKLDSTTIFLITISGYRLCFEAAYFSGLINKFPIAFGIAVPCLYAIGPAIYLYLFNFYTVGNHRYRIYIHFIPFVFSLLPVIFWLKLNSSAQLQLIANLFTLEPLLRDRIDWGFMSWVIGPKLLILFYSNLSAFLIFKELRSFSKRINDELKIYLYLLLAFLHIMILADIIGYILSSLELIRISAMSHSISVVAIYLFGKYQPNAILEYEISIQKSRYEKSKLNQLDVDKIIQNMEIFMKDEHFYADEDLRIADLAESCGISIHQLSEILNRNLKMSFTDYVNMHRIAAAKDMIIHEPDRTILSIAIAVGYNSKSAFNRSFKKIVNLTPSEYKKQTSSN